MSIFAEPSSTLPLSPTLEPLVGTEISIRAAIDRVGSMRFRFVQLSATQPGLRPRELDQSARRDLLATLRRRELTISGLDAWIPSRDFLDQGKVDRAVSAVQQAIECAADFGRVPISLALPAGNDEPSIAMCNQITTALAAHAARFGVALADHSVPVLDRGESLIGVGIDPAAWLAHGDDPAVGVSRHAERLISARLVDLLRSAARAAIGDPQDGRLDVLAYRVALTVSGYRRALIVDARQWSSPWAGLERTQQVWGAME